MPKSDNSFNFKLITNQLNCATHQYTHQLSVRIKIVKLKFESNKNIDIHKQMERNKDRQSSTVRELQNRQTDMQTYKQMDRRTKDRGMDGQTVCNMDG